ncbi:Glycosyl transferase [Klebsormidium nitens]|uniref:Glycosyl transferase n=1 Tax=Klebsormidium nitens TaxID=105231 RepID=A0A1Y1I9Y2_KLENI|nr:Glycosyl transferase [Klebsormidium nitens]|eukprot:GAQ86239.1 Glycosyl transferase [Klebsormidium nitens]
MAALLALAVVLLGALCGVADGQAVQTYSQSGGPKHENAYATILYTGTVRDYEFYIATRVMLKSLQSFHPKADTVILASVGVPVPWLNKLAEEGHRIVVVSDVPNPFASPESHFQHRFLHTFNKLLGWSLTEYKRVVMLDADNLFLQNIDELFQCGKFCAAFINPCTYHTGLFVLEPSNATLSNMLSRIASTPNRDGADQGFLTEYYPNTKMLMSPMFDAPVDGSVLDGEMYRLHFGYQMDAGYYYLSHAWHIPCPNKVVTFPSVPLLKPWYWWSYPVLPLGTWWHQHRWDYVGYGHEVPALVLQGTLYLVALIFSLCLRRKCFADWQKDGVKPCLGNRCGSESDWLNPVRVLVGAIITPWTLKVAVAGALLLALAVPAYWIPTTVHPFMAWPIYFLGALALTSAVLAAFPTLPVLPALTPWLIVFLIWSDMANPYWPNIFQKIFLGCVLVAAILSPFLLWAALRLSKWADGVFERIGEREPLMGGIINRTKSEPEACISMAKLC